MRVSIVATALDGEAPESKTVLNMVNRIQNRNSGYSEGLFSKNTHIENNTFNSISGATALKLDEEFETNATVDNHEATEFKSEQESIEKNDQVSGISIENIPYLEKNISTVTEANNQSVLEKAILADEQTNTEEYTPPLFADDNETDSEKEAAESQTEDLFDQDNNDEEDFEIPAFLRKQKF